MKTKYLAIVCIILLIAVFTAQRVSATTVADATAFCAVEGRVGRFGHADPTKFYYCYLYGGQLLGQVYTCSGVTIFDAALGMCTVPVA